MGFPTPFPDPDSPELQRFALRSPSEIVSRLRALREASAPLTAFLTAGESFGVVTLRSVDETAGRLVFEGAATNGLIERLRGAPLATFVGYDEAGKVQFSARPLMGGCDAGDQAFDTQIPKQLFSLQRRRAARMRVESARGAVCRIPVPGVVGQWEVLRVLDISAGGFAVLTYPERLEPVLGLEIKDCRLDLPGVGGALTSVRVRHIGPLLDGEPARWCGCEFLRMTPALNSMIARFLEGRLGSAAHAVDGRAGDSNPVEGFVSA